MHVKEWKLSKIWKNIAKLKYEKYEKIENMESFVENINITQIHKNC